MAAAENRVRAGPSESVQAARNAVIVIAAALARSGDQDYVQRMSEAPDSNELARQLAVLEERMNTMQAEYRTDIARLAEDMAKREAEAAKREVEKTERAATARWWQTAIILAGIGIAAAIIINYLPD